MEQRNGDLYKEIEAIASEAEKHSAEDRAEAADGVLDPGDVVFRSTSRGVAVCRMLFDKKGFPEDYLLESVNPSFGDLFGVVPGSAAGRRGSDFFADGKRAPLLDVFARVLVDGETASLMFFMGKFGRVFDILVFTPGKDVFVAVFGDAAKQTAAERERRENERFVESVLGSVDVWIALLDERGGIIYWNTTAEGLSGVSADEALSGRFDFWDVFYPEEQYREYVREKMDDCRKNGVQEIRMESSVRTAGGETLLVEWTARPWRFEDVDAEGLLLLGRDVTEKRRMEDELRESERRYAAAFRETSAPMLLVDPESGSVVDCNDAALAFYGYSREEMLALKDCDFSPQPCGELRRSTTEALSRRRSRVVFEHRLKNGDLRTVEAYCSPMPYHGRTLLFFVVHDITEQERLEERLRLISFDYALQAKILGSILDSSSDYLYVFDREGRFRFVGKKAAALFHRNPEELSGLSWGRLGIPEERVAVFNERLREVFSTGAKRRGLVVLSTARGDKPMEYALEPTCDDDGNVGTVFCSMREVP